MSWLVAIVRIGMLARRRPEELRTFLESHRCAPHASSVCLEAEPKSTSSPPLGFRMASERFQRAAPPRENPQECRYPKGFLRSGGGI